jgi:hypothetical protein
VGYWHLQNTTDFIRNGYVLANLERIRLRDCSSANAIRSYVNRAELISPQAKKNLDEQKKLISKHY